MIVSLRIPQDIHGFHSGQSRVKAITYLFACFALSGRKLQEHSMRLTVLAKGQKCSPCVICSTPRQTNTVRLMETNNTHKHHFVTSCSPGQTKQHQEKFLSSHWIPLFGYFCSFIFASQRKHRKNKKNIHITQYNYVETTGSIHRQTRIILPINIRKTYLGSSDYSIEWYETSLK